MPDVLQTTFDVDVDGDTYTFKIPNIRYRMEVAGRATDIRRRAYPEGVDNERNGLIDNNVYWFSRCCAILELYLQKSTCTWPYGEEDPEKIDRTKLPVVSFDKFPFGRDVTVEAVGLAFENEMNRFRKRGNTDSGSTGE